MRNGWWAAWFVPGVGYAQSLGVASELSWPRAVAALLLCLALAVIVPFLLLRVRGSLGKHVFGPSTRRVRVIEHAALARRVDSYLVEVDSRTFLLVVAPSGVAMMDVAARDGMNA